MSGLRLAVLVSGGGTNLQSVIDAVEKGVLKSNIVCVISNKADAYGLERAKKHQIPALFIDPKGESNYNEKLLETLEAFQVDIVVLAGYLKIIDHQLIEAYRGKIINIHPSLLPKYGGKGFYGMHVHEAVIASGDRESGATVHYVDAGIDTGKTILQKKVAVQPGDTAKNLQQRVLEQVEHTILVEAISKLEEGGAL